jgi:uncharacterized membrane protein
MLALYRQIFKPALLLGLSGGILIIALFFTRRAFDLPGRVLLVANCFVIISMMTVSVLWYKNKVKNFKLLRELSFAVYAIAVSVLLIFRFAEGYFSRFSFPAVCLGIFGIFAIGRGISWVLGMLMSERKEV